MLTHNHTHTQCARARTHTLKVHTDEAWLKAHTWGLYAKPRMHTQSHTHTHPHTWVFCEECSRLEAVVS